MIVYGDPQFSTSASTLLHHLRDERSRALDSSLETTRRWLIHAGQFEQALLDALEESSPAETAVCRAAEALTDLAAGAFMARTCGIVDGVKAGCPEDCAITLPGDRAERVEKQLDEAGLADLLLTVNVPEGYEFYTLYPEQYVATAVRWWQAQSATTARVVVLGIRSIGTSLSAVVTAALRRHGCTVLRRTVRPTGHPFSREAKLPPGLFDQAGADWTLIVDEGPGISGSSMAAVAAACVDGGCARERIVFFPGHGGAPGPQASDWVRSWWDTVPRWCTPLSQMRWSGQSLPCHLLARAALLCPGNGLAHVEDFSGGLWRRGAYKSVAEWPAVAIQFERQKYRCTGTGQPLLWKFAGLGSLVRPGISSEQLALSFEKLQETGWPRPLGVELGFVAWPWIEGVPCSPSDASDLTLLEQLAAHLCRAPDEVMGPEEQRASFDRLARMAFWNVQEELGETAAAQVEQLSRSVEILSSAPPALDGRMAPSDWIRTRSGALVKPNWLNHELDHTCVGRQSWLWDLAGVMVEWQLSESQITLFSHFVQNRGWTFAPEAGRFFRIAYRASRIGQLRFASASSGIDCEERARLVRAADEERDQCGKELA
jgi:hypothetical protein